ncbi:MAG: RagB/SusD family nutrient uptake outer membrane protein [Bacteroidales bacterium]
MKLHRLIYKGVIALSIFCASGSFSSCESFLDKQEDEALTFEKIWLQRATTRQYWLHTMSFLPNDANDFCYSPWQGASDEGSVTYNRDTRWMNFGSWNASSVPYYKMQAYYQGIRECNIFLQNVDKCTDPLLTPGELAEWKVQTRFARSYYYFLMLRIYGPVILVGDELLDFTASTEDLYRPRNTWDECVKYVVDEMTACAEDEAMKSGWETSREKGLATKGACQAVISRLKLYSARDLFNGNKLYSGLVNPNGGHLFPQTYDDNKWLEATEAAKVLIDNPTYQLYRAGDGSDPYANWLGITKEKWNSELIWTTGIKGRYIVSVHTVPTGVPGTSYGGVGPTQQQVDAFAMKNGKYPITGYKLDGDPIIDQSSGYSETGKSSWTYPAWGGVKSYTQTMPNMYKDREPRFYISVFFGGTDWYHGTSKTMISFAKGGNGNKSHDYPKPGYLINRFYDHELNSSSGQWGEIVFPTFRLGEMYLNFIESVLESRKRGLALPAGYESLAMQLWSDLRDRAGVPAITSVYPDATIEELIELVRAERRVELVYENHRYFDTRTWMIAEKTDGGPMYGMDTTYPAKNATDTPDEFWKRTVFETRVFKANHYLYPFSQRELDRNKLLVQNYGW